jgi:hypothetical protein
MKALTREDKVKMAIAWLRSRNLYVLDKGSKAPKWNSGSLKREAAQLQQPPKTGQR